MSATVMDAPNRHPVGPRPVTGSLHAISGEAPLLHAAPRLDVQFRTLCGLETKRSRRLPLDVSRGATLSLSSVPPRAPGARPQDDLREWHPAPSRRKKPARAGWPRRRREPNAPDASAASRWG